MRNDYIFGDPYRFLITNVNEDSIGAKAKRIRFLAMLKKRYGYSNDTAVDEMKRILKQFYRSNKLLGIHHRNIDFPFPNIDQF